MTLLRALPALAFVAALAGCVTPEPDLTHQAPTVLKSSADFDAIPRKIGVPLTVAVYDFPDKTGQRKPSERLALLSTAVTQGAADWVSWSLTQAGGGSWFQVVERTGLDHLVKERQIIRSTRDQYLKDQLAEDIAPLIFAGVLVEGAIIGYESNVRTGGKGARLFGIGASEEYQIDNMVVSMRLISVSSGQVLSSVIVKKAIASERSGLNVFRFVDLDTEALEIEFGSSVNEPQHVALQRAIETAVAEIIQDGIKRKLWSARSDG